jgi:hypothetical protein
MKLVEIFGAVTLLKSLPAFASLYCFIGMAHHQHDEDTSKRNFTIAYSVFLWHQRTIVIFMRDQFGPQAIGWPSFYGFLLMCVWAMATQDPLMLAFIGLFLIAQIIRRIESVRLGGVIDSRSDGRPYDALRYCQSWRVARLWVEPILIGALGACLWGVYSLNGWNPTGVPYYLCSGVISLPFVELVNQTIHDRKLQSMRDARHEQEVLMNEYHNRFGD